MESIIVIDGECIIPDGTTKIFKDAFEGCSGITSIKIPACVKEIDYAAFDGLDLESIDVDVHNRHFSSVDNCLLDKEGTELIHGCKNSIIPSGVEKIGPSAFYGCSSLTSVTIPETVTYIGCNAFYGCTTLTEIVIPSSVTYIDSCAFEGCYSLKKVVFKTTSIKEIDRGLFQDCKSLKEIIVPEGVKRILNGAFCGCKSLSNITLPASLERLEDDEEVFVGCNLDTIAIDPSNKSYHVKDNCLLNEDCTSLIRGCNSSNIPSTVKEICSGAFSGCTRLADIVIPDGVEIIGGGAFTNCVALKSIVIPESVERVCGSAFEGCENLCDIVIPESTQFDPHSSFRGCPNALSKGLYSGLHEKLDSLMERSRR